MNLRKLAKGQDCQVRIVGVCNFNPETTVLAHLRMAGLSGMGIKASDVFGAWCCSACHSYVDTHTGDDRVALDFLRGVMRTQAKLLEMGALAA